MPYKKRERSNKRFKLLYCATGVTTVFSCKTQLILKQPNSQYISERERDLNVTVEVSVNVIYVLFFKLQLTALLIVIKTCSVEPQQRLKNCNLTRVRRNGQPGASGVKFALLGSVFPLLRQCRREI